VTLEDDDANAMKAYRSSDMWTNGSTVQKSEPRSFSRGTLVIVARLFTFRHQIMSIPVHTDTERNIPSSHGIAYRTGDLDDKRGAVLDDFAPSIPELDMDTFIISLLPPLVPDVDTEKIMENLIMSGDLVIGDNERFFWSAFPTDPASSGCTENETFAGLAKIYSAVMKNVPSNLLVQATSKLVLNPNSSPYSQRTHQTRPDGFMVLNTSSVEQGKLDVPYWADLSVTMELKKNNSNNDHSDVCPASIIDSNGYWLIFVRQNVKKQVFSMQQVMIYDPCRRFTFGLTIENTDIRLWFCSRSGMIVSEKLDFNKVRIVFL
jgi:hypothetical protein